MQTDRIAPGRGRSGVVARSAAAAAFALVATLVPVGASAAGCSVGYPPIEARSSGTVIGADQHWFEAVLKKTTTIYGRGTPGVSMAVYKWNGGSGCTLHVACAAGNGGVCSFPKLRGKYLVQIKPHLTTIASNKAGPATTPATDVPSAITTYEVGTKKF